MVPPASAAKLFLVIHLLMTVAFVVANARISYATEDNRYEVSVWMQNVGDEEYRTFNGPITGNGYTLQQFGKPRWAGATLRVNF